MATFVGLKGYRERAGISQNELSRLSGVSRDTISSAERGNNHSADRLHAIRNALNDEYYGKNGRKAISPEMVED